MSMSSDDLHSLNQLIYWLQQLYEKQKKGKPNPSFDIKPYLCYQQMPVYQELILSDELLCCYAAKLFFLPFEDIKLIKKYPVNRENCLEITFEIHDELKTYFIKQAWEGAIKEAIGLEFNNLLTDTTIRYLCSHDIIITEKVFEPLAMDTLYQLRESNEYVFAYGAWEIFTRLLRLTDRKTSNVRWNGSRLANIDFGLVFYKGTPVFDSRFTLKKTTELRKQGQIYALKCILTNFQRHQAKLEDLLFHLDVHFCRNIHCSRTPREPLKVILTTLKEISSEITGSINIEHHQKTSNLAQLQNLQHNNSVLYVALMTNDGVLIDELKSSEYNTIDSSIFSEHLLNLIIAAKKNTILNTEIESIQIDLTAGKLVAIWNKNNGYTVVSLLKPDASVAHIKVNMRKAIEQLI